MDLNNYITELIREAPGLGVMTFMVVMFLKHLGKRDEIQKTISDQCHEVQRQTITSIRENAEALQRHNEVIHDLARVVERCRLKQ